MVIFLISEYYHFLIFSGIVDLHIPGGLTDQPPKIRSTGKQKMCCQLTDGELERAIYKQIIFS